MKEFVLLCALAETSRFTSFRRAAFTLLSEVVLGIIYKMLTQPLHLMECEGLIARTVHAVVPPKVGFIIRKDGLSGFEERHIAGCFEKIQQFRREIVGIPNPEIERVQPCLSTEDRDDFVHGRFGRRTAGANYKQNP